MKRINLLSFASLATMFSLTSHMTDATGGGGAADVTTTSAEPKVQATGAEQPVLTPEQKTEFHSQIKANFNNKVDVTEYGFHFRKVANKIKDEVTGEVTVVETKRNSVILPLPTPSVEGIIAILEAGGKGLELLLESVQGTVQAVAREYIDNNEGVTSTNFPFEILSWEAIANLPKSERRGGGISKEVWEDFAKDYTEIMPALLGKTPDAVAMAAKIFLQKFAQVKTNKNVLSLLKGYLAIYISNTKRAEEFAECVDWLDKKAQTLIDTGEEQLLSAL